MSALDLQAGWFDDVNFLSDSFVDMTLVVFAARATMWLAWDTPRGNRFLRFLGLTPDRVLHGPFRRSLQWWLHVNEAGQDRDA
jgi:hypothetical protein